MQVFELLREADWSPRYNISPTQQVAVIRKIQEGRALSLMKWGLVPAWSKDPKKGPPLINARSESIATKPSFRDAFRKRRCLIPADGFYEWKATGTKVKQPYHIRFEDGRPFAFAGLWEHWGEGENAIDSCTIITTEANDQMRTLHERMPVILQPEDYERWLDPNQKSTSALEALLVPFEPEPLTLHAVNTLVNSPRNDTPACLSEPDKSLF
jgi:putative SOS response-associated peptidase YedK